MNEFINSNQTIQKNQEIQTLWDDSQELRELKKTNIALNNLYL